MRSSIGKTGDWRPAFRSTPYAALPYWRSRIASAATTLGSCGAPSPPWLDEGPRYWAAPDPGRLKKTRKDVGGWQSCSAGPANSCRPAIAREGIAAGEEDRSPCSSRPCVLTRQGPTAETQCSRRHRLVGLRIERQVILSSITLRCAEVSVSA